MYFNLRFHGLTNTALPQDVPQRSSLNRHADSMLHRLALKEDPNASSVVLLRGVRAFGLNDGLAVHAFCVSSS